MATANKLCRRVTIAATTVLFLLAFFGQLPTCRGGFANLPQERHSLELLLGRSNAGFYPRRHGNYRHGNAAALFVSTPQQQQGRSSNNNKRSIFGSSSPQKKQQQESQVVSSKGNENDDMVDNVDQPVTMDDFAGEELSEIDVPLRFEPPVAHTEDNFGGMTVRGTKFRKLKDMMWIRETVEDLTAAEFACSVEAAMADDHQTSTTTTSSGTSSSSSDAAADRRRKRRRRAVDYDKLLSQLNKRLRDLGCLVEDNNSENVVCELQPGVGQGTTVYDDDQRRELFE